jgi:ankyrin repeat protein
MRSRSSENEEFNSVLRAILRSQDEAARLLKRYPERLEARDAIGETPLHWLAVENRLDALAFLAKRGAQVDARNQLGQTPLMDAARLGHAKMVQVLLALGADANVRDAEGHTVLDHATLSSHRSPAVLELLKQITPESS